MSFTLVFLCRQQVLTELVAEINVELLKSTFPMHEVAEMEIEPFLYCYAVSFVPDAPKGNITMSNDSVIFRMSLSSPRNRFSSATGVSSNFVSADFRKMRTDSFQKSRTTRFRKIRVVR